MEANAMPLPPSCEASAPPLPSGVALGTIIEPESYFEPDEYVLDTARALSLLLVGDRRHIITTYKRVMVGSEAVDWMIAKGRARTREEAVALGQRLMENDLLHHCPGCLHIFKDVKNLYYRFGTRFRPWNFRILQIEAKKAKRKEQRRQGWFSSSRRAAPPTPENELPGRPRSAPSALTYTMRAAESRDKHRSTSEVVSCAIRSALWIELGDERRRQVNGSASTNAALAAAEVDEAQWLEQWDFGAKDVRSRFLGVRPTIEGKPTTKVGLQHTAAHPAAASVSSPTAVELACPICTYVQMDATSKNCEMCGTALPGVVSKHNSESNQEATAAEATPPSISHDASACNDAVEAGAQDLLTNYAPRVFGRLRSFWHVPTGEFSDSMELVGSDIGEGGKSGAVFLMSKDQRYIVKEMTKIELLVLLDILPSYVEHILSHPDTLLPRVMGAYKVLVPVAKGTQLKPVRLMVMSNALLTPRAIHIKFDLKGSTVNRLVSEDKIKSAREKEEAPMLKDLNLDHRRHAVRLDKRLRNKLLDQLKRDCKLLEENGIMDYSLLLGISHGQPRGSEHVKGEPVGTHGCDRSLVPAYCSVWQSVGGGVPASGHKELQLKLISHGENDEPSPRTSPPPSSGWRCKVCTFINEDPSGVACEMCGSARDALSPAGNVGFAPPEFDDDDVSADDVYFLSLIDILQRYDASKQLEHIAKASFILPIKHELKKAFKSDKKSSSGRNSAKGSSSTNNQQESKQMIEVVCPLCTQMGQSGPQTVVRLNALPGQDAILTCPSKHMFRLPRGTHEREQETSEAGKQRKSGTRDEGPQLDVNTSVQEPGFYCQRFIDFCERVVVPEKLPSRQEKAPAPPPPLVFKPPMPPMKINCSSCSAALIAEPNVHALRCPFCSAVTRVLWDAVGQQ